MALNTLTKKTVTEFDLESLVNPLDLAAFFDRYWEREPLILHRDQADYYQNLFSIEEVDHVLDVCRPTGTSIRVVKSQQPLIPSKYENHDGSLNLNQLYASYSDGYTIVINEMQRFWQPLQALCQKMSQRLSHHTVGNMYLTPKNQKALLPHYDTHDVFVIQVHGKKHWKIYDPQLESPLLNSFQPIFKREQLKNSKDVTLCAGDMMYMPRGVPHEAFTTDESSLHITIGVHPAQWLELVTNAIKQIAYTNVAFRKALPPGYLNGKSWTPDFIEQMKQTFGKLIETVAREANIQGAAQFLAEEFRNQMVPGGDGHFLQLDQIEALDLESVLEKRQEMTCTIHPMGAFVRIVFPGNTIKGPAHIGPALQFIAQTQGPFRVNDLPDMSDANRLQLVNRLIRGGLLKASRPT